MPSNPGDQKKREKKKRKAAERHQARRAPSGALDTAAVLREAAALPMGPCFISADWRRADGPPRLVTLLFTRRSPIGVIVPTIVLVDRTCLGVKNAFVAEPMHGHRLPALLAELSRAHEGGMTATDVLVAQSVLFHALDYAASLGFAPHADFPEILVGPRPAALVDTPHARPARPFYVPGPDDDVDAVLRRLEARVGVGSFDLGAAAQG